AARVRGSVASVCSARCTSVASDPMSRTRLSMTDQWPGTTETWCRKCTPEPGPRRRQTSGALPRAFTMYSWNKPAPLPPGGRGPWREGQRPVDVTSDTASPWDLGAPRRRRRGRPRTAARAADAGGRPRDGRLHGGGRAARAAEAGAGRGGERPDDEGA